MRPDPALVARFKVDLQKLTGGSPEKLGLAVSGGADSLALLLLAAAAYPDHVEAATVDHGLRRESAEEARLVARVCAELRVPHEILAPIWSALPSSNVPARAREARYRMLSNWAARNRLAWIATAHHLDDQAETFLMRLARGSGVAGLAGVRAINSFVGTGSDAIVRPLLEWRKSELAGIVSGAGLQPVEDPTNDDESLDRTHARRLLQATPWLEPARIAATAANLLDAEEALGWTIQRVVEARLRQPEHGVVTIDPRELPRELQRRLLELSFDSFNIHQRPRGSQVARLLDELRAGRGGTLAGIHATPGELWTLRYEPPRRTGCT